MNQAQLPVCGNTQLNTEIERSSATLRKLNHRKVAVRLVVGDCERLVRGTGTFELDSQLGGMLRIDCADSSGSFEMLLRENDWNGEINSGEAFGCDYVVHLVFPRK